MVANQVRYLESFTGGAGAVTFPLIRYEYDGGAQAYRNSDVQVVGADYAFDNLSFNPAPKGMGVETVRFLLAKDTPTNLSAQFDSLLATIRNGGKGQLYTTDAAGDRRWCWARLDARPGAVSSVDMWQHTAVMLRFRRYSDWFGATPYSQTFTISTNPAFFTIFNPGNAPTELAVWLLTPLGINGIPQPRIDNLTNFWAIQNSRTVSSLAQRFKWDGSRQEALWSVNGGISYSDDWANILLGPQQASLMRLEPGTNNMRFIPMGGGTPSLTISVTFSPAFH